MLSHSFNTVNDNIDNDDDQELYAVIDRFNPIYVCEHALKNNHKCVYAICNKCKLEMDAIHHESVGCAKTTRSTFRNVVNNNIQDGRGFKRAMTNKYATTSDPKSAKNKCDHILCNLKAHYDTSYYEDSYLSKQRTQKACFPFCCSKCKKEIRKK